MGWRDILQLPEKGKKGKQVASTEKQVSHLSLFPTFPTVSNEDSESFQERAAINEFDGSQYADSHDSLTAQMLSLGRISMYANEQIYSELLKAHVWLVPDDKQRMLLVEKGIFDSIYTHSEREKLELLPKDMIQAVDKVMRTLPGSKVNEITSQPSAKPGETNND